MRNSLLLFIGIPAILDCCTSTKNRISLSEERKKIASFILVESLPVYISTKDSTLCIALQIFMADTLKAKRYLFITQEERELIFKKHFDGIFGGNDKLK